MPSPHTSFRRSAGVRLRPAPEIAACFAYDPAGPRLYTLNTTSWLVLLLCNGASSEAIAAGFHQEVEPLLTRQEAADHVDEALADLIEKRLIAPAVPAHSASPIIAGG